MGIAAIRGAVKAALDAGDLGLHAYDYEVDAPALPAAIVTIRDIDPRPVMGPGWTYTFAILLLMDQAGRGASVKLEELLDEDSDSSIVEALRADPTLGGVCSSLDVTGIATIGQHDANGVEVLGCIITVEVMT
jgi:hypothetical protein